MSAATSCSGGMFLKKEFYEALSAPFNGHPRRLYALRWINRITTGLIYVLYICIIVYNIVSHQKTQKACGSPVMGDPHALV